ncbi:MAG TPA: UDP-3-O-acyl-N-acetylglucosamine deacetylase [Thermoanaerobaculia bacterium]|nr:UDP-3-O-acyl-N-acetylglucosamine deacetylase [Thermoanaerobaculia bacterium]HXK66949.1 UDP-3-O-acyl-N-acetylglucosamine deacetylase [Thermoanaerobaculia bacterium]
MTTRIMIVDDEQGIRSTMSEILTDEGYEPISMDCGEGVVDRYINERPDVIFLDIWLPDRDGLEILQAIREKDPSAAIIMISGHGTIATAVKAMKMGAYDYIEKPLSYHQIIDGIRGAIAYRRSLVEDRQLLSALDLRRDRHMAEHETEPPPHLPILRPSSQPQRTIRHSTVIYGHGLHSGKRTGLIIQPLPAHSGIHLLTLPSGTMIPAHLRAVANTTYATTLSRDDQQVFTVEHFLSALHAYGITNLLIKVHGEIPVMDGSAVEFCRILEEVGIQDQDEVQQVLTIDRPYEVKAGRGESLLIEPDSSFSIHYLLQYPPPIGEQSYSFTLSSPEAFVREIAPARTFGFMKDLKMLNELGLGSGGRLDNCILVGEDEVINTTLRFPDEFVRHKILDIIGDLFLLGFPVRGKVTARLTGHQDNIALLRKIVSSNSE